VEGDVARLRELLAAGVGDLSTAAVAAVLTLGYLAALRPLRSWMDHVAARSHTTLAVTLTEGAVPEEVIRGIESCNRVSVRLLGVEKHDGRLVALVKVEGRPEAAVATVTGRLASLDEVTDLVLGHVRGQVALADDADNLAAVDHREAAHFLVLHRSQRLVDRVVGADGDDLGLISDVAGLGLLRILAFGDDLHGDVAVCDHSHQPIVIAHRHRAGIDLGHDFRHFPDALTRARNAHFARHCIADSH